MFLLIRGRPLRIRRKRILTIIDVLGFIPVAFGKILLKEYGVIAAGVSVVILVGIGFSMATDGMDWELIWKLGKGVGFFLLFLFSLFRLFLGSNKKS